MEEIAARTVDIEPCFHSISVSLDARNGQTDEYEFRLVSLDGKSWNFAAPSLEVSLHKCLML